VIKNFLQNRLFVYVVYSFYILSLGFFNISCEDELKSIHIRSSINHVQPMTGIVLWEELNHKNTDAIQLEYSYMRYNDVVKEKGIYDWSVVEKKLNSSASRSHQAIMRFWDTYPGRESAVPDYIKKLHDYHGVVAKSENRDTGFPDWSNTEYQRFMLEFFEKFAERYDRDPRLAFLEVGFGLWSEYHIYDPGEILGTNFPSMEFQAKYFKHLANVFKELPWMISEDAHLESRTPFASQPELLDLKFGIFDDSFYRAWEPGYNLDGWKFFGMERFKESPVGGEITFRQKERSDYVDSNWVKETRHFGITFMICEQWLRWISIDRIRANSMVCGYKFKVTDFKANNSTSRVTVENTGVAPIYYDAYITVNGVRSLKSLKYLQPGESAQYMVKSGGQNPILTIECDRLVPGQIIEYAAELDAK
jgi:hypothetical protein